MSHNALKCDCCGGNLKIMPMDSSGNQVMYCPYCKTTYLADMASEIILPKENKPEQAAASPLDLSNWDTSNVTRMVNMFAYCKALPAINLSSFNTSNIIAQHEPDRFCPDAFTEQAKHCGNYAKEEEKDKVP